MRFIGSLARWTGCLTLLLAAANIDDPYLSPLGRHGWLAILLVSVTGIILLRRARLLLAVVLCVLMLTEFRISQRHARVIATPDPVAREYGQHFIIGYRRAADIEPLVAKGLIGGIYVSRHNIRPQGTEALRAEIAHFQALRRQAGLPPLIVATDQEGGIVSHLSPPLTAWPPLSELASLPPNVRETQARDEGKAMGDELRALGITVDFAPVADLLFNPHWVPFDFNSLIRQRAISPDPDTVTDIAGAFAQGLDAAGIMPTIKHFPGLGRVPEDTHHFTAHLRTPSAELATSDWKPFRAILARQTAMLMVGHVVVDSIDARHPASQSRNVVNGLIRDTWHYQGPVVTDDLVMGSVFHHDICNGVTDSLNAGVDLLLIAYDGRQYDRLMDCVLSAAARGAVNGATLAASDARLTATRP